MWAVINSAEFYYVGLNAFSIEQEPVIQNCIPKVISSQIPFDAQRNVFDVLKE